MKKNTVTFDIDIEIKQENYLEKGNRVKIKGKIINGALVNQIIVIISIIPLNNNLRKIISVFLFFLKKSTVLI